MKLPRWLRWRTDREFEEELRAHLDLETQQRIDRGMSPEEARSAARRTMGNLTLLREHAREADPFGWLLSVRQDVRYALRNLARNPGFTAIAILSLALGIGANTAIFTVINAAMLKSLPVSHPEELVLLIQSRESSQDSISFPNALWEQIRDHQSVFAESFSYGSTHVDISSGGEARSVPAGFISGDFFAVLGVRPVTGRIITRADDQRSCADVAVISHSFWQSEYGGAANIVNQPLTLDGHPFQIIGVAEPSFFGVEYGYHVPIWVPSCAQITLRGAIGNREIIGRVKPGVTLEQVRANFAILAPTLLGSTLPDNGTADAVTRYRKTTFDAVWFAKGLPNLRLDYGLALFILLAVAGVVLLIACVNVANLLLARATARRREIVIRMALGASRKRLIRQLLTESMLLSLAGAAAGLLFARWASHTLTYLMSRPRATVALDLSPDAHVLAFTIAVGMLTGVLFGLAPAWRAVRVDPQASMKLGGRGATEGFSRFSFAKALVAAQVALSLVCTVSAGLLLGSWRQLVTIDPGFRSEGVLVVGVNTHAARIPAEQRSATYEQILERLRAIPGVAVASAAGRTPIGRIAWRATLDVPGYGDDVAVELNEVSDRYFAALGTQLLGGRDFDSGDVSTSSKVAIVSEELARRFFGGNAAIGRHFRFRSNGQSGPSVEIVGIAANIKQNDLRESNRPMVYLALSQNTMPDASMQFALRTTGEPRARISSVTAAIADLAPRVTLNVITLQEQIAESVRLQRTVGLLSGFFAALALLLASIGLYGIMAYTVARRRNEIGVRIALGAGRTQVVRLVLGDVARIALAGLATGALLSLILMRFLGGVLYGIGPNDPTALVISALTLFAVALGGAAIPARNAARVDPVVALREE